MKKVGILTFHRAHNYGAVLQCYALQEVLKDIGYDVKIINYKQTYIESRYSIISIQRILEIITKERSINRLYKYFIDCRKRKKINTQFSIFQSIFFDTTDSCDKYNIPKDFDIYIIGSDQMWGLQCTGGIDKVYFGDFDRYYDSKLIGYAISSNIASINKISTDSLKQYANNFSALSFRESFIANEISEKIGIETRIDVDPTLLADASLWHKITNEKWKNEKYIILYNLRGPKEMIRKKAELLATKIGCAVIDLSDMLFSPSDFVSLFKYAQYVITSSFHATVFSLIFEKPFYAIKLNDGHDERYVNLVKTIGAENVLVDIDFEPIIDNIDYTKVREKINKLRLISIDYLRSINKETH